MLGSASKSTESTVINAPATAVWDAVKDLDLSFWSAVQSCTVVDKSPQEVGSSRKLVFKDGTEQVIRVVELSELRQSVSYELVESTPPVSYMSAVSTIAVQHVTSNNSAFITWETIFSSDGGVEATQDSKFKKQEALYDLEKAVLSK